MKASFIARLLFLCAAASLPGEALWTSWDTTLSLEKESIQARSGDNPAWADTAIPGDGWTVLPLSGNFMEARPDWGPIVWYRAGIRFPEGIPPRPLSLKLGKIADFDRCYFNGILVGENAGYTGRLEDELFDIPRVYEIPLDILKPGQVNTLAIRIDNREHRVGGLISGELTLSVTQTDTRTVAVSELQTLALIVFYIITGIYFLFLFVRIPANKANLFFGLFCLCLSVYFLTFLQARSLFIADYGTSIRLRYSALWGAFPLFLGFFLRFMRAHFRISHYTYFALSLLSQALVWLTPSLNSLSRINSFFIQPSWIYPVAVILFIAIRLFREIMEARIMLILLGVFIFSMISDIIRSRAVSGPLADMPYLTPYGLLLFILGFALILLNRQVLLQSDMEKLFVMATRDRLTGTATRAHLENFLAIETEKAVGRKGTLTVIMADLDNFKRINDTYGHPAGDTVLREFGELLRSHLRDRDLAGRYGGEEFLIVLPDTDKKCAAFVAQRIRSAQEKHIHAFNGERLSVTASMGIAELSPEKTNTEDLIKAADDALYSAKHQGKNRVETAE